MEQPLNKKVLVVVDMQNDFVTGSLAPRRRRRSWITSCAAFLGFDG
jgi:nicotinamidase-related amidase